MGFIEIIALAVTIGLGCGTCCGSATTMFLSGYVISESDTKKGSFVKILIFFLGKILGVLAVCIISAIIGQSVIESLEGVINIELISPIVMLLISIFLIASFVKKKKQVSKCTSCSGCSGEKKKKTKLPLIILGFVYGISPCLPLITITTYAITLDMVSVIILATAFALASSTVPILISSGFSVVLASKIKSELGNMMPKFQICVYAFLFVMSSWTLAGFVV